MVQSCSAADRAQVLDTMIALTRLSNSLRVILAGKESMEHCLALRQRGFVRVSTPATCRLARGQHAVGLITGQNSLWDIEASLDQIARFLAANAALAVLIDSRESGLGLKVRARLERLGFRIEAGVRCQRGFVLSAYRQGFSQMSNAA
ncbi:hypothetical protein [Bradyrhizobium sp.]|uniref:hypothetical protein n=1 Tax=Bradyrhizobium sp. TaxID=376 RepID=UPI003C419CA7